MTLPPSIFQQVDSSGSKGANGAIAGGYFKFALQDHKNLPLRSGMWDIPSPSNWGRPLDMILVVAQQSEMTVVRNGLPLPLLGPGPGVAQGDGSVENQGIGF